MNAFEVELMKNRPFSRLPESELLSEIEDTREAIASVSQLARVPGTVAFGTVANDGHVFVKYLKHLEYEYQCRHGNSDKV
jgi:hypothetical protein